MMKRNMRVCISILVILISTTVFASCQKNDDVLIQKNENIEKTHQVAIVTENANAKIEATLVPVIANKEYYGEYEEGIVYHNDEEFFEDILFFDEDIKQFAEIFNKKMDFAELSIDVGKYIESKETEGYFYEFHESILLHLLFPENRELYEISLQEQYAFEHKKTLNQSTISLVQNILNMYEKSEDVVKIMSWVKDEKVANMVDGESLYFYTYDYTYIIRRYYEHDFMLAMHRRTPKEDRFLGGI